MPVPIWQHRLQLKHSGWLNAASGPGMEARVPQLASLPPPATGAGIPSVPTTCSALCLGVLQPLLGCLQLSSRVTSLTKPPRFTQSPSSEVAPEGPSQGLSPGGLGRQRGSQKWFRPPTHSLAWEPQQSSYPTQEDKARPRLGEGWEETRWLKLPRPPFKC